MKGLIGRIKERHSLYLSKKQMYENISVKRTNETIAKNAEVDKALTELRWVLRIFDDMSTNKTTYSQGVCGDGVAILRDGVPMTVDEIVRELNA